MVSRFPAAARSQNLPWSMASISWHRKAKDPEDKAEVQGCRREEFEKWKLDFVKVLHYNLRFFNYLHVLWNPFGTMAKEVNILQ